MDVYYADFLPDQHHAGSAANADQILQPDVRVYRAVSGLHSAWRAFRPKPLYRRDRLALIMMALGTWRFIKNQDDLFYIYKEGLDGKKQFRD